MIAPPPKRILFVDDDMSILQGLQRMLRPMRKQWTMEFVASAEEALAVLERQPYDAIVTDMRMPGMDGAALLTEVTRRHPRLLRLAVVDRADRDVVMRAVTVAHQSLAKPCEVETLKSRIAHAFALRDVLADDGLKTLVSRIRRLPSMPTIYADMMAELQRPEPSPARVGEIVATDAAMTAKILQLVNSAFFGLPIEVSSAVQAVQLLGLETVRTLVVTLHIFKELDVRQTRDLRIGQLWRHSLNAGACAKNIMIAEGGSLSMVCDSFTAGLLHDVGKLVLATSFPQQFVQAMTFATDIDAPAWVGEVEVFGSTHAEVGAYLLGLWGLPDSVVEAVGWHHRPVDSGLKDFLPLTVVHAANALDHELYPEPGTIHSRLDTEYLASVGCGDRPAAWHDTCRHLASPAEEKV
jgi:HD-like signal output (HDOD) protein